MKRILALLLVLVVCLSLCACGSKEAPANVPNEQTNNAPIIQETPTETTLPETTATPEPVYETIEITMDNWQEYFEFRMSDGDWKEDAFGDTKQYQVEYLFSLKSEYLDRISPNAMDIALIYSYIGEMRYYEIDLENRIFTLGEKVDDSQHSMPSNYTDSFVSDAKAMNETEYCVWWSSCSDYVPFTDRNGKPITTWIDGLDIERIQGTIEIQTN